MNRRGFFAAAAAAVASIGIKAAPKPPMSFSGEFSTLPAGAIKWKVEPETRRQIIDEIRRRYSEKIRLHMENEILFGSGSQCFGEPLLAEVLE